MATKILIMPKEGLEMADSSTREFFQRLENDHQKTMSGSNSFCDELRKKLDHKLIDLQKRASSGKFGNHEELEKQVDLALNEFKDYFYHCLFSMNLFSAKHDHFNLKRFIK